MRLDSTERNALRKALAGINPEQVFLFGSRVDDGARGGDIDVLVFSQADPLKLSRRVATRFFMECEERIDVVVMNPRRLTAEQRAFLATLNTEHIPTLRCVGRPLYQGGGNLDSFLQGL